MEFGFYSQTLTFKTLFSSLGRLKTSRLSFPLDVETWFHVIHDGPDGKVSDEDIKKQLEVLNSDYNSTMLFRFKLAGITRTENKQWFGVGPETPENKAMKVRGRHYKLDLFLISCNINEQTPSP